ncbi:UNVERIFIED_CONTAM: hypothetical protein FKN15_039213 [Acipenser sinensis]
MDRNALAELLQALESRRDAEERRREERYTALIERPRTLRKPWQTAASPGAVQHSYPEETLADSSIARSGAAAR